MTYAAQPRASAAFASVFAVLLIASYAVLPQPKFEAPSITKPGAIDFDNSTAYIKQDHVGGYWLCIQNEQPIKLTEADVDFYKQLNFQVIKEHS